MKNESLEFSTEIKEITGIKIDGKLHKLVELTGTERDKYLTNTSTRIKYEKGQAAGMKDLDGIQAQLLHLSLRNQETGERIPVATLQKWPASVLQKLYKLARELSALGDEDDEVEKAKNVLKAEASESSGSSSQPA